MLKKIDYNVLAKAIIEQYNASQLAGASQSVKAALDALNSKINNTTITTINDLNTYLSNASSAARSLLFLNGTVTNTLVERNASSIAIVAKMDAATADMSLYSLGGNYIGIIRYNFSTSTVTKKIEAAQKSDVDALNSNLTNTLKSGANNIDSLILGGYTTGSGNYIDVFVPLSTSGKTVTAASASSSTIVFLPTKHIEFSSAPTISVLATTKYGVRLELSFPSTQTGKIPGTVYLTELTLTCS